MRKDETSTYYTVTKKYHLSFPQLEEAIDADVVIIGGGFTGIHTALELAENGITNTVVLEAQYLGYGGTGRNGGHVMAGIGHDLDTIKKDVGEEGLRAIFALSDLGPQIMRDRIEKYEIDADYHHGYGYLAYNGRQAKTLRNWEQEFRSLNSGKEIRYLEGREVQDILGSDVYHSALLHMGGGHVHALNLLLGEAKAVSEIYGARIFEYSPALEIRYGDTIQVRTAKGLVRAKKLVWACDSFLNKLEPKLYAKTVNTYSFQIMTEPLPDELIRRISPIRGAYSDIRPVINYYRVTAENRLLFGSATGFIDYTPTDLKKWGQKLMLEVFPYLKDVHIDLAWGGPMAATAKLFPQVGTLDGHKNVFAVQGYAGFGVTPSQIICKILAEGILGGSQRFDLLNSISHRNIPGKDQFRAVLCTLGKVLHQSQGYFNGRR